MQGERDALEPCEVCGSTAPRPRGVARFCSFACRSKARRLPVAARFWRNVARGANEVCWPWTGFARRGYGWFYDRLGTKKVYRRAHRVAWELVHGDVPAGGVVCHRCDNPLCCNPMHLFVGSHADNVADKMSKGRQARGPALSAAFRAAHQRRVARD